MAKSNWCRQINMTMVASKMTDSKEFGFTNLVPPNWKLKNLSNINAFFGDLYMEEFLRTQTQLSKHMLITLLCGLYFVQLR